MRHLLERTERADEIPDLARKYAEAQMMRRWLRWKPHLLTHQEVRGVENVDRTRSVILSFMHHNQYCGLFWSLDRVGKIGRATSELQSLMRNSYAVFFLNKNNVLLPPAAYTS